MADQLRLSVTCVGNWSMATLTDPDIIVEGEPHFSQMIIYDMTTKKAYVRVLGRTIEAIPCFSKEGFHLRASQFFMKGLATCIGTPGKDSTKFPFNRTFNEECKGVFKRIENDGLL